MDNAKKTVVALGMFDGVHIGHKKLIDTAVLIAKARGLVPAVYTFSNHPQELCDDQTPLNASPSCPVHESVYFIASSHIVPNALLS